VSEIEIRDALALLHEAKGVLVDLHGREIPRRQQGKSRAAEAAELTRELLRVGHLLDKAKVLIMDQYWLVKEPTNNPTGRDNNT
jgi:hypothetical protein